VIPPPAPVIYVPVPGTNTVTNNVTTVTVVQTPAPPPPVRIEAYCMPNPVLRPNGTMGTLIYLPVGEPQRDPTYQKAIPASFVPGVGMKCAGSTGSTVSARVPMFTLTVPASFVGQFVRLCLQPASLKAKPLCHAIRIDRGATIAVPVTSNVVASVLKSKAKAKKASKSKSKNQIAKAASAFSSTLTQGTKPASTAHDTTRKGTRK
jgi:hypothetical protein